MKLFSLFALVLAALALFAGAGHAEPKVPIKPIATAIVSLFI
jgi:hypothetical protein